MTLKHTKKNVSAEKGTVAYKVELTGYNKTNKLNPKIKVTSKDFLEDGNDEIDELIIPLNDFYDKNDIDAKTKFNYRFISDSDLITQYLNDLQGWASIVAEADEKNYIFLIPKSNGTKDMYIYDDSGENATMFKIGTMDINLDQYLKINDFTTQFAANAANIYTTLDNLQSEVDSKQPAQLGQLNEILMTDDDGNITTNSTIDSSQVSTDNLILENIGTSVTTLEDALLGINSKFNDINTNFQIKASLKDDVWGSSSYGFRAAQLAEAEPSAMNMATGAYAYRYLTNNYYTKTEVNNLIGTVSETLSEILEML